HAAVLCPSFYRVDIVSNPNWWDRTLAALRSRAIARFGGALPSSAYSGGASRTPSPQALPLRGEEVASSPSHVPAQGARPLTILIAARGGEGGGVLTDWIVTAAASQGFPVQSTSIPGVAQRTGATTYHIELVPTASPNGNARPVLA